MVQIFYLRSSAQVSPHILSFGVNHSQRDCGTLLRDTRSARIGVAATSGVGFTL